jgi:hypothetical protein
VSDSAHRLGLVAAALLAGGCATSRQCTIPEAPLAPPPGPPLPARVGVAYPDGLDVDSLPLQVGSSGFRFPTGPAAVAAFNQVATQLFERPVPAVRATPVPGGPEAVLSFTLDELTITPGPFSPEAAEVKATAVLRDARGVVAQATATARAEGTPHQDLGLLHCDSAGAAIGSALATVAVRLRDELGASPALAAWVRDPARLPPPGDGPEAPLPAPAQPPEGEGQSYRAGAVPRFLELNLAHGATWGDAPGMSRADGLGLGFRVAWDIGDHVALGLLVQDSFVEVDWTPDPAQPTDTAESGLFGLELMVRFRPGEKVRPWLGLAGTYQAVTWDHYFVTSGGFALMPTAGLDVATGRWGWLRLGLAYSSFQASMSTGWDGQGAAPPQGLEGQSFRQRSFWLTVGWVLDLGPTR